MKVTCLSIDDLIIGKKFEWAEENIICPSYKYADLEKTLPKLPIEIKNIISGVPIKGYHKHILLDIKFHDLEIGKAPALRRWHFDCVANPLHDSKPEIHHLFVTGECRTNFLSMRREIEVNPFEERPNIHFFLRNFDGVGVPSNTIVTYGRFFPHLPVVSPSKYRRLLIRVTETDVIRPNNREFKVNYF